MDDYYSYYFRPDFKYKKYFREEKIKEIIDKYLIFENKAALWKKFDFAGEDKYNTTEGGGGCYFHKEYHVKCYSFRKTKKGQLLYIDYEIIRMFRVFERADKYIYLNKKITKLPPNDIKSTYSYDDDNIIVTDGTEKPYIYNIEKDERNNDINLDNFCDKCYDAIMLENKLIVVSGLNLIGYYSQNVKNQYKIIHTYKPKFEDEQMILIYLIEFIDNLLNSCYKKLEKENNKNKKEKDENEEKEENSIILK